MDPDADLFSGLRSGDRSTLATLFERHGDGVYRTALRVLGQPADAEDALQDVFVKLHERGPQFRGRSRLRTWIWRIAVNVCLHRLEREGRRRSDELCPDGEEPCGSAPTPFEAASLRDEAAAAERLLAALPLEQRLVVHLFEVEGLGYREIAAALEIPEGTVMSRLARARARLAQWLQPNLDEPSATEPSSTLP